MKELQEIIDRIKSDDWIKRYLSVECDFDIEDKYQLADDLEFLLEGGRCELKLTPFGCDGSGGVYVLAEDGRAGYIDSEGRAGFAAMSAKDLFSILLCCGCLSDWADASEDGCFDSPENFKEFLEENKSTPSEHYKQRIGEFTAEFGLESDPEKVYELFRNGVRSQPPLEIKATDEDYEDYEPLFELS